MGEHDLDAVERIGGAQQLVTDQQADLAHDVQRGMQQQVERACHHPFGAVFQGHYAVLGIAAGGCVEHFVE